MSDEAVVGTIRNAKDAELISRLGRGEPKAAVELYDAYFDRIYALVFNQVARNREASQDIVQETFLAALKSAGKFNGRSQVYTWLYSIAIKKVADFYRRQKRIAKYQVESVNGIVELDQLSDSRQSAFGAVESDEEFHAVQQALSGLSLRYRQVLVLKYVEDMPVLEISRVMGRSPKSIEGLLTRARKELRAILTRRSEG
jgi:RNA polymerase sigma-70 factor (ECF subfamily)